MLNRKELTQILQEKYPYLESEYGIGRIGLFGSYAKGEQTENSDIDLVAEFKKPIGLKFIELTDYLEKILGKKIDILTPEGIDSIYFKKIADSIRESIVYV